MLELPSTLVRMLNAQHQDVDQRLQWFRIPAEHELKSAGYETPELASLASDYDLLQIPGMGIRLLKKFRSKMGQAAPSAGVVGVIKAERMAGRIAAAKALLEQAGYKVERISS